MKDKLKDKLIRKDWLRIFSPAIIGIIFCVIVMIISLLGLEKSGGWSLLGVLILFPVLLVLLVVDLIVKLTFKNNNLLIWFIELATLGLSYFFFVSKFI